jgi:hypothetical protein
VTQFSLGFFPAFCIFFSSCLLMLIAQLLERDVCPGRWQPLQTDTDDDEVGGRALSRAAGSRVRFGAPRLRLTPGATIGGTGVEDECDGECEGMN